MNERAADPVPTLAELYAEHQGKVSDKWASYLSVYQQLLEPWRDRPVRLLEIGVQNGGSLEIWRKYFRNASVLLGCDVDPRCAALRFDSPEITVVVGDASKPETVDRILSISDSFDVVIDDGSHASSHIVRSFLDFFPHIVAGGVYIAEDLHCSYWQETEGGLNHPVSSIAFFKDLVDCINARHWGVSRTPGDWLRRFGRTGEADLLAQCCEAIESMSFHDSVCAVRRRSGPGGLGVRIVAGHEATVIELQAVAGQPIVRDETGNPWSLLEQPAVVVLPEVVAERDLEHEQRIAGEAAVRALGAERDALMAERDSLRAEHQALVHVTIERDNLRTDRDALAAALASTSAALASTSAELVSIRNSTLWALGAPLRTASDSITCARRFQLAARQSIAARGGVVGMLDHHISNCRRYGWRSALRRWRSAMQLSEFRMPTPVPQGDPAAVYSAFIARSDDEDRRLLRQSGVARGGPLISILMPVWNPPVSLLAEAVESVVGQVYANWELCIVDDASDDQQVRTWLESATSIDARIRVRHRTENGHICRASNDALEMAQGEFVALLDHDDRLHPFALLYAARSIAGDGEVDLLYTDEDKISEDGRRFDPYLKSDFNYELLLSQNLICHLGIYRTRVVRDVGGFRPGFEGAQDHDLALRVLENCGPNRVRHVARVLYHWRSHPSSTAASGEVKPYAWEAGRRAISEHLQRTGLDAEVEAAPEVPNLYRPRFAPPASCPDVELIIPTRDRIDLLRTCVESIRARSTYPGWRLCIVDNGSTETETLAAFDQWRDDGRIRILPVNEPFNFSRLNNLAVRSSEAEYVVLLNNDIEVITPDWIEEMLSHASRPGIGCVGARLWYPDETLQHGGVILGINGVAGHAHKRLPRGAPGYFGRAALLQSFSAVTAACLMVRRDTYQAVGGLDESLAVAFNDIDFCLKVRQTGLRNVWTPFAEHYHHESASRGLEDNPEKQERFTRELWGMRARWGALLEADPAYSPHLTLRREDFSLAP